MDHGEPDEVLFIRTQAHWKALAHPLRLSVVRLLRQKEMTNEELARALEVASGKLHFHTKQLLDAGLIRFVGTRQKQAITEKLYRATAKRFRTSTALDADDLSTAPDEVESAVELYRNSLQEHPETFSSKSALVEHSLFLLPPHKAEEVRHKLVSLVQEALANKSTAADAVPMALTVLLYRLPGPVRGPTESRRS